MKTSWNGLAGLFFCTLTSGALAAPALSNLRSLGVGESAAANPTAEVIAGQDGGLYGTTPVGGTFGQGTVYRLNKDGSGFHLLKSFGAAPGEGTRPVAGLLEASDGMLYGSTVAGGQFGFGTLFRLSEAGSNYSVLWNFTGTNDGAYPEGRLLEASNGLLYGTASGGGTNDYGVVFRLAKDGSGFQSLVQFSGTNGANPEGSLLEASDGLLYGTTVSGGTPMSGHTSAGTVFSLDKNGTNLTLLSTFTEYYVPGTHNLSQTNGFSPYGNLVEGTNGMLYGTTASGGINGNGTVYEINKDGTGFRVLYNFGLSTSTDGRIALAELLKASDGALYGTTYDGGSALSGTVFRIGQDGSNYTVLTSLSAPQGPAAALAEGDDGLLYGTTQFGGASGAGVVFKLRKNGSGFTVLSSFSATGGDGQSPGAGLALVSDGGLYGTTRQGGSQGAGTVFSLRFDGRGYRQVANLNSSGGGPATPLGSVVEGTNGLLYGNSQYGGASGKGTIFNVQEDGAALTTLYSPFGGANGVEPRATLIQASDGFLYGTTVLGGTSQGTLFRANPDGSGYAVITNFTSTSTGANPVQPLVEASDHRLYGCTYDGGSAYNGVLFRLNLGGSGFQVLQSFTNATTLGANPSSPLLEASDGFLYGTTYSGGSNNNAGTVFRMAKDGSGFQSLYAFVGTNGDARHPCGRLVQGADGALYGTTERGGANNDQGALYTISTNGGGYAVLASFGGAAGQYPKGGLVPGPDGALYGTTDQGGTLGFGTVFRYGAPIEEITDFGLSSGYPTLTCVGIPGTNYWVERTAALGPAALWVSFLSTNAPANGQFSAPDQSPLAGSAFYRMRR